jgi:4-hydroxy-tetrahydrodipicolinate synthase
LPLLAVGADGVISVASNEVPRLMRQLFDERSIAIHNRLLPLMTANFIESNPGPAKAVLKMMGVIESDAMRAPLAPVTAGSLAVLREIVAGLDA